MLSFFEKVFSDYVSGQDFVYSDSRLNELLGCQEMVSFTVIARRVTGTNPWLVISIQHSADGTHFQSSGDPGVNQAVLQPNDTINFAIAGIADRPRLNYVRLEIFLTEDAGMPTAFIEVWASGRSPTW